MLRAGGVNEIHFDDATTEQGSPFVNFSQHRALGESQGGAMKRMAKGSDMTTIDSGLRGFYHIAAAFPERVALAGPHIKTKSFGQLNVKVNQLSHALRALGLGRGDVVAALVRNDDVYFELVLATGQIGLYLVPINTYLVPREVAYIVQNSGAKVLVAHADLAVNLDAVAADLPQHCFSVGGAPDGWTAYEAFDGPDTAPEDRVAGAVMGYTSGTTGRPKGVKRKLTGASPDVYVMLPQLAPMFSSSESGGVHLVCSPLYHAAPGAFARWSLELGYTVVCHPKFDAEMVLRDIARHRVTMSHMVPIHFRRLLAVPLRERYDVSSLQALVHAGAPCPVAIKQAMIDWVGPIVWEYLGATEGLVSVVGSKEWLAKPGTVGKPGPGVKLLDAAGREVPVGEAGTIYFDSGFEYHNDPVKTAASRVGKLVSVGDVGRFDEDGYLFVLDRRDDLILSGGVNIYPAEIESYLITHPSVEDVAVFGVPDPEWGQSVLAVVQPAEGTIPDGTLEQSLLAYCADGLAPYKRPRRIEFRLDFPRTASGKLQRRVLRDSYNI